MRWAAANLVTGARLVGAPLLVAALVVDAWQAAAVLVVLAIASDVADGWLARRLATATVAGRWLDHLADIAFLLAGFATLAARGSVPSFVPAAVSAAFAFYVVDSLRRSPARSLIASRLGHLAGILNYGVLAAVIGDAALGTVLPAGLRQAMLASVPLYSGAAIVGRIAGRRRQSTLLGAP